MLESFVTKTRDKAAALKFIKKILKRHGRPRAIVTDGLRSYDAAMREIGNVDRQETGRWLNNRAENSHLPFRRRERATIRFRRMKTLQKFSSVRAPVHNHFAEERHLISREIHRARRSAALAAWRQTESGCRWTDSTPGGLPKPVATSGISSPVGLSQPEPGFFPADRTGGPSHT